MHNVNDSGGSASGSRPFAGLSVLEATCARSATCVQLAAALACRIAADLGATVYRLEVAQQDTAGAAGMLQSDDVAARQEALYEFVHAGKAIVRVDEAQHRRTIERLVSNGISAVVGDADTLRVVQGVPCKIPTVELALWPPGWRNEREPATEFTVLAASGMLAMIGDPKGTPLRLGGHQAAYAAGLAGFSALSAGLTAADAGLPFEPARTSLVETMLWVNWKAVAAAQATGNAPARHGPDSEFMVMACSDGWTAIVYKLSEFDALYQLTRIEALKDERFSARQQRAIRAHELKALLEPWFANRTRAEVYDRAQACGVPLGPVYDAADLVEDAQFRARDFIAEVERYNARPMYLPRLPVLWNGHGFAPVPARTCLVEEAVAAVHSAASAWAPTRAAPHERGVVGSGGGSLPLAGVRVVDFGQLTAGANTSAMLADLGAEVIKVESPDHPDLFRLFTPDRQPGWWNRSAQFLFSNRNKKGIAVNAKTPEGREIVRRLIANSHIVVENFRRGVLERMGIDFETISAGHPGVVFASISSQGETGPNRMHVSFGSTLDATAGIAAETGYAGGAPIVTGPDVNYPDQVVSLLACGLVVAAVRDVRRNSASVLLDMSQREITAFMMGDAIVAQPPRGSRIHAVRRGNADPDMVFQDCIADGTGGWVAVSLASAADLRAMARVLQLPPGTLTATNVSSVLAEWVCARTAASAAAELRAAGVAAERVLDGVDLVRMRDLLGQSVAVADDGVLVKGMPYMFGGRPFRLRLRAPDLGQHTDEVLRDLLGLDAASITDLADAGVTAAEPAVRPEQ